jgi:hypothetical protein
MNVVSYLVWSSVASLVMVGGMRTAQSIGLSRMSLTFILGTAWSADRSRAAVAGLVIHVLSGLAFGLVYVLAFESLGRANWWIGALGGVGHAFLVLTVLIPVLPYVHPRMAYPQQGPTPTRWLQPPGLLALNYGRRTPFVILVTHAMYGAILGGFYELAH